MKCFYCYQEYKVSKRPLLMINDANLFSEGTGYCFEHRGKHFDLNVSKFTTEVFNDYRNRLMEESISQHQSPAPPEKLFGGLFSCKY